MQQYPINEWEEEDSPYHSEEKISDEIEILDDEDQGPSDEELRDESDEEFDYPEEETVDSPDQSPERQKDEVEVPVEILDSPKEQGKEVETSIEILDSPDEDLEKPQQKSDSEGEKKLFKVLSFQDFLSTNKG